MSKFAGIPGGRLSFTAVPNVVFSELLPLMDDADQIQVTLHLFYLLSQKKGKPRFVTFDELRADATLMQALDYKNQKLKRGLEKAVRCGALLEVDADGSAWYLFNTPESRKTLEQIERGELNLPTEVRVVSDDAPETPNIYKLYEREIGVLTPMIAEELKEVEQENYPPQVILDAFRSAAENNKRSWRYVSKILENWAREHKYEKTRRTTTRERRPQIIGRLADVAKPK